MRNIKGGLRALRNKALQECDIVTGKPLSKYATRSHVIVSMEDGSVLNLEGSVNKSTVVGTPYYKGGGSVSDIRAFSIDDLKGGMTIPPGQMADIREMAREKAEEIWANLSPAVRRNIIARQKELAKRGPR